MVKQIITTSEYSELSARKPAVWNPLDFAYNLEVESDFDLDEEYFVEIEESASSLMQRLGVDDVNILPEGGTIGMEVGDDRVSCSSSSRVLLRELVLQEKLFKMVTSWNDTYISKFDWNFCEVTSQIPRSRYELFNFCAKATLEQLGFNDVPILRLIGNVQKGDASHSSSATGKASLLARRMTSVKKKKNWASLQLASFLQDGCLNTPKSSEPKYLHGMVGGAGCPPLWGNADNTFLFVKCYKNGTYSRVYGTAIEELEYAVNSMDTGRPASILLSTRLRQKQEYLHITYAHNVLVPGKSELIHPETGETLQPLYKAAGSASFVQGAERRLLSAKRLLTRTQAEVELSRTERITKALYGLESIRSLENMGRSKRLAQSRAYDGALNANAAVSRLLLRHADGSEPTELIREGFLNVGQGVRELTKRQVRWLCDGGKGVAFTIDDINRSEDMYIRSEVSLEESLKVPGIPLNTVLNSGPYLRETVAKVGLWQVAQREEDWADDFVRQVSDIRSSGRIPGHDDVLSILQNDRWYVNDDLPLLGKVVKSFQGKPPGTVLIVSTDIRLSKLIALRAGQNVLQVHPEVLAKLIRKQDGTWSSDNLLSEEEEAQFLSYFRGKLLRYGPEPSEIILDSGSMGAYFMKMECATNGHGINTGALAKKFDFVFENVDGKRTVSYREIILDRYQPFKAYFYAKNGTSTTVTIDPDPSSQPSGSERSSWVRSFIPKRTLGNKATRRGKPWW